MNYGVLGRIVFAVALACAAILVAMAAAWPHGDAAWIQSGNFKGPDGTLCCGVADCHRLAPDEVKYRPGAFTVLWKDKALPFDERHVKLSHDNDWWACIPADSFVRCLWRPPVGG